MVFSTGNIIHAYSSSISLQVVKMQQAEFRT